MSALVLPGAGHLLLKRYASAAIFGGFSLWAIYYITTSVMDRAYSIVEKMQSGGHPMDIAAMTQMMANQAGVPAEQYLSIATTGFILCWVVAVIDAYRVGSQRDKTSRMFY